MEQVLYGDANKTIFLIKSFLQKYVWLCNFSRYDFSQYFESFLLQICVEWLLRIDGQGLLQFILTDENIICCNSSEVVNIIFVINQKW